MLSEGTQLLKKTCDLLGLLSDVNKHYMFLKDMALLEQTQFFDKGRMPSSLCAELILHLFMDMRFMRM